MSKYIVIAQIESRAGSCSLCTVSLSYCAYSLLPLLISKIVELSDKRDEIMTRVQAAIDQACEHRNSYVSYTYLWADNRQEFLQQFLRYGHVVTAEEIEAAGEEGVPENPPTLNQFKEQVNSYEKVYSEVEKFEVNSYILHLYIPYQEPWKPPAGCRLLALLSMLMIVVLHIVVNMCCVAVVQAVVNSGLTGQLCEVVYNEVVKFEVS